MKLQILTSLSIFLTSHSLMHAADYSSVIPRLEAVVREEMAEWGIGGVAVALVDDQETVYLKGFGEAKDDSVFRVGSISKLFNAIAVMQQVENGKLDLDAPVDPELLPWNPFPSAPAVTLRQLLCHMSGLQREATIGSYFDPDEPSIAATLASLRNGVLATRPGEKIRYSNIGATLAGRHVEIASGMDFVTYQKAEILQPLGMARSAWVRKDLPERALVKAHMRVTDGKGGWYRREAPVFDLGTIPAGNLYATAGDVARFASAMLAGGNGVIKAETLAAMWDPQFIDAPTGFGLGFSVGKFREHRTVGHTGAVFGFSSALMILPDAKVAAVVLINEDIASGRVAPIRSAAISALLEIKHGEKPPTAKSEFRPTDLEPYVGEYESRSYWAKLWIEEGKLVGDISGQPTKFTATGARAFIANSRIHFDAEVTFQPGGKGFNLGSQTYQRVANPPKKIDRPLWKKLIGSYGHDFIPIVISERHGHLYAMTENMVDYRLTPVNQNVFELPPGMYINEHLVFMEDAQGNVPRINFCNVFFDRIPTDRSANEAQDH